MSRYIIIKLPKARDKEKILKASRGNKKVYYIEKNKDKDDNICFLSETMQEKTMFRILSSAKIFFKIKRKDFFRQAMVSEITTNRPTLQMKFFRKRKIK